MRSQTCSVRRVVSLLKRCGSMSISAEDKGWLFNLQSQERRWELRKGRRSDKVLSCPVMVMLLLCFPAHMVRLVAIPPFCSSKEVKSYPACKLRGLDVLDPPGYSEQVCFCRFRNSWDVIFSNVDVVPFWDIDDKIHSLVAGFSFNVVCQPKYLWCHDE